MLEKQNIKRLEPIEGEKEQKLLNKTKAWVDEAINNQFSLIENYTDGDFGVSEGLINLSISKDNKTILWIQKSLSPRYRFITRMENGKCIVTSNIKSTIDLSNLEIEEMVHSVDLTEVYKSHNYRIMNNKINVIEFDKDKIIDWLDLFKKEKVKRMITSGYAIYINNGERQYRYTFNGAFQISKDQLLTTTKIIKQQFG